MKLYSPLGVAYETNDKAEVTRLKSQGYAEKKPTPKQIAVNNGGDAPAK